jgi:hypothetical protein
MADKWGLLVEAAMRAGSMRFFQLAAVGTFDQIPEFKLGLSAAPFAGSASCVFSFW